MPLSLPRLRADRAAHRAPRGRRCGVLVSAVALGWVPIPGTASAAPVAGGAAPAGFSGRNCSSVQTGDLLGKLDMCTLSYAYPTSGNAGPDIRFVVQLHSYRWAGQAGWLDSTSQSLTVNSTEIQNAYPDTSTPFGNWYGWGQNVSPTTCRHGSPEGPQGCSVPNAVRMDFYSTRLHGDIEQPGLRWRNLVFQVSWRDVYGQAHYWSPNLASPTVYGTLSL